MFPESYKQAEITLKPDPTFLSEKIVEQRRTSVPKSGQTVSGYGRRLATGLLIRVEGDRRWYRVYCICYSNVGSAYIRRKGQKVFIRDGYLL